MYLLHLTAVQTYCILLPYSLGHCFMLRVRCRRQRQGHGLREVQELHPSMYAAGSRLVESRVLRDDSTCQEMGHGLATRHRKHTRETHRDLVCSICFPEFSISWWRKAAQCVRAFEWRFYVRTQGSKFRLVSSSGGVLSRPLEDLTRIKTRNDVNIDVGVKFGESQTIPVKMSLTEWVSMCPL